MSTWELCRIIPTDSIPENANFGLQRPNVQGIELFENVNFVNDRFNACIVNMSLYLLHEI